MDYIFKLAETIELTMDIPESEKKLAANSVIHFQKLIRKLDVFDSHLDKMYNPFKKYTVVSKESVLENRWAVWNYFKQIKENFKNAKDVATVCANDLEHFSNDPTFNELKNSFIADFGDVESSLLELENNITNYEIQDYKNIIVKIFDNLKKQIIELKKLIFDRIITNINTNILAKNWVDKITNDTQKTIEKNEPLISRLYREREEGLKSLI